MALDVGDARIGVALSDPLGITAQPFASVDQNGRSVRSIIKIIEEQNVREIVVGLPLELNGEVGTQAKKVEEFVAILRSALDRNRELKGMKIGFWDERFTTAEAKRVTAGSGLKNEESRAALDRVSATLILEGYLERAALIESQPQQLSSEEASSENRPGSLT